MSSTKTISVFSPAKINLFLAITGVGADGFHELVSLVAPLMFGDFLTLEMCEGGDHLVSNATEIPLDENNLILKAVVAFREKYSFEGGVRIELEKYIPVGAGLGGGSSNAVAALEALNLFFGNPLEKERLAQIAGGLGSDCPLFLERKSIIMRGRGEIVECLHENEVLALKGRRILLFKPDFSINTGWAYDKLRKEGSHYVSREAAESGLGHLRQAMVQMDGDFDRYFSNNFESVIYEAHKELEQLSSDLKKEWGVAMRMSGSGSACFCMLDEKKDTVSIREIIKKALGNNVFMIETFIK